MELFETERIRFFDGKTVSFGRHETFPLRYSWLTKGFQAFLENPKVFENEDAPVILGVGKNMVRAIRFWLLASGIIFSNRNFLEPTQLGEVIFSKNGWDPYLEDEATIWLIHWLLASNPTQATVIYWFFNNFHKPEFTSTEIFSAFKDFVKEKVKIKVSLNTLKQDISTFLRMYVPSIGSKQIPIEEALDSPLSLLDLIGRHEIGKRYQSKPGIRDSLPVGILGFCIFEVFEKNKQPNISVETLFRGDGWLPGIGSIFRLTEDSLITKIEELIQLFPGKLELRESAGIHQLYQIKKIKPLLFLEKHYSRRTSGAVAV